MTWREAVDRRSFTPMVTVRVIGQKAADMIAKQAAPAVARSSAR